MSIVTIHTSLLACSCKIMRIGIMEFAQAMYNHMAFGDCYYYPGIVRTRFEK